MKKIFYILILAASIVSCKKDNNGKLDPNAMISIWPSETTNNAPVTKAWGHLTNIQIVKQARNISFYSPAFSGPGTRAFTPEQRDSINVKLLMWGTDIIDQFGNYVTEFIEGHDFVIRRNLATSGTPIYDTIAYIPNSVIVAARTQIKAAYDSGNYATVYDLFNTAFSFTPCTGYEWRQLKAQGQN